MRVRDRSDFPQQQKKVELVAPEEICAAIEQTVEQSFGLPAEDVAVAACHLLGFARVTACCLPEQSWYSSTKMPPYAA